MELEWMLLANHAEASGGLLYISGAGWDTITVHAPLPSEAPEGIFAVIQGTLVIRLLFHQTEVDREHSFSLAVIDEDGNEIGKAEGNVRVDRQLGLPVTWKQAVNVPIPLAGLGLPRPGMYTLSLQVNGQHVGDRPFRVLKGY